MLQLAPLFLSLPNFIISLGLAAGCNWSISAVLAFAISSAWIIILRLLGCQWNGTKNAEKWALSCGSFAFFLAVPFVTPTKLTTLLVSCLLIAKLQTVALWSLLFLSDIIVIENYINTLGGYTALAASGYIFMNHKLALPSYKASLAGLAVSCGLLFFLFQDFSWKMWFISVGSLAILLVSQIDESEMFNKHVFAEKAKTNLFIVNCASLFLLWISQSTSAHVHGPSAMWKSVSGFVNAHKMDILTSFVCLPLIRPKLEDSQKMVSSPSILRLMVTSKETRSIFNFFLLNFSFMFVQLLYSFRSKSLSLLSDSLHMLLDCVSLALGLAASLMAKRDPDVTYPFGLSRAETLAGFTNGTLLIGIVFGIVTESLGRIMNPVKLEKTSELLFVSVLGLLVNLVGMSVFDHGHSHSHSHSVTESDSHSHSHSHSHSDSHSHSHSHSQSSSQSNDNMRGVFLHVMADTLGSVGVVISTLVIKVFGLHIIDPIMSLLIAALIFASSIPLLKSSAQNLILSVDNTRADRLKDLFNEVLLVPGVKSYTSPRFWPSSGTGSKLTGVLHVQFYRTENSVSVKSKVEKVLTVSDLFDKVYLQCENEVDDCWCR